MGQWGDFQVVFGFSGNCVGGRMGGQAGWDNGARRFCVRSRVVGSVVRVFLQSFGCFIVQVVESLVMVVSGCFRQCSLGKGRRVLGQDYSEGLAVGFGVWVKERLKDEVGFQGCCFFENSGIELEISLFVSRFSSFVFLYFAVFVFQGSF